MSILNVYLYTNVSITNRQKQHDNSNVGICQDSRRRQMFGPSLKVDKMITLALVGKASPITKTFFKI